MALSTTALSESQCHMNDDIEGVTIPVDEWIAKELARIKEKQEPRHCHDYEALIEVIEEIGRMPTMMMKPHFNTDQDANGSAITLDSSSMMVLLGRAFISLWKYCWDEQYAPHHPYPVGLLLDIEKLTLRLPSKQHDDTKKKIPAMQGMIQAQLSKACYIQIPTPPDATSLPWLSSFQVIQQWLFPLSEPSHTGWYSSFITGMDAYRTAKSSLPFTSHLSHSTVDHLEELMQKTHL